MDLNRELNYAYCACFALMLTCTALFITNMRLSEQIEYQDSRYKQLSRYTTELADDIEKQSFDDFFSLTGHKF